MLQNKNPINCFLSIDISEARRHPKIIVPPQHNGPIVGLAKEYAFNNYEYQGGNSHPVDEDTVEVGHGEPDHGQESDQQSEHSHETDPDRHEKHHHQHHDHIHVHHTKSIHHPKKPGFSAGSGLRSIAQGSADQASSAVSNQVRKYVGHFFPTRKRNILTLSIFHGNLQHAAAKQAAFIAQNTLAQVWERIILTFV